ncbi:uncharacterized protein LOC129980890 isoform X3 [Argiope bruennichi]|uniref:uncharacterized protein LOC129980890 isoform X3 n=1 Tax=Argiope bruennichi TaxID=94029 RepID=UPI002494A5A5|nr:uncharacterized protein LOC129980890 isoform X3 [Argiope bruennichi]
MNLEILLFTFLLQWVATNAEDTNENEYNKNLIRNFLQHYAMHYPKIYDYDTKTKLYPPSHDSSEENSEFYSGNDSSPQSDGSPHVHYHHHIYGERHHTPQNENDGKAKEYNSPTLEEKSRRIVEEIKRDINTFTMKLQKLRNKQNSSSLESEN